MGQAVALRFAREGAALVLTDISGRRLQATVGEIARACPGTRATALRADVTSPAEVDALAAHAVRSAPPIDVLVNVVGGMRGALFEPLLGMSCERWDQTMALNLRGNELLVQRLAPSMRARGYGRALPVGLRAEASRHARGDRQRGPLPGQRGGELRHRGNPQGVRRTLADPLAVARRAVAPDGLPRDGGTALTSPSHVPGRPEHVRYLLRAGRA